MFVPTVAVFGCVLVDLGGSVLTGCGFVHAVSRRSLGCPCSTPLLLGSLTGAEYLLAKPTERVKFGHGWQLLWAWHLRILSFSLTAGLTLLAQLKPGAVEELFWRCHNLKHNRRPRGRPAKPTAETDPKRRAAVRVGPGRWPLPDA